MKFLLFACLVALASADVYMQNPRGSNDRCNENNTNRNNANRLFDSQNNAKGGYCWGPKMYFYEGSQLRVEWTNQHECGGLNNDCNVVIQYMCEADLRDGVTTDTIPTTQGTAAGQADATQVAGNTFEGIEDQTVFTYGRHETFAHYDDCDNRERNKGLFTADRNVNNNNGARATRQNNNGNRHGYECAEERDYFPYWHPSPWKDVAVLATRTDICDLITSESQNVKEKNYCSDNQYNNQAACEANDGQWLTAPAHGIDAPDCIKSPYSRDNHLGNAALTPGQEAQTLGYNWTIPDDANENCALRLRYNISSYDYDGWFGGIDAGYNGDRSPVVNDPFPDFMGNTLSLAIATNQFGRTFQDRSHTFEIRPRADGLPARVFNLNVRGKRGNIVQTYPSTEYDHVPNDLDVRPGDGIHVQWTGCNQNPNGNDGEGTRGTDRNNIVPMSDRGQNLPTEDFPKFLSGGDDFWTDVSYLGQGPDCPTNDELLATNNNNQDDADRDPTNCMKLNAATAYYDAGVVKVEGTGVMVYMNSRNNNYTNRSQKAAIRSNPLLPTWAIGVLVFGAVVFVGAVGTAGAIFYAKNNPQSGIADTLSRF